MKRDSGKKQSGGSTKLSVGETFIEATKHRNLTGPSDQQLGLPQPPLETPFEGSVVRELPPPENVQVEPVDFKRLVDERQSVRDYGDVRLSLNELSYLLWCTQGVKKTWPGEATFRTVPSAGARHALETYLLVNDVEGLDPGLYRYLALRHKLGELEREKRFVLDVTRACCGQLMVAESAATFVWTAEAERMKWRYGERGYRYLHLDVGHVCQNLYLAAETIGCGVCAIAAFDDDVMSQLFGLDGRERFVIYVATVGKKK